MMFLKNYCLPEGVRVSRPATVGPLIFSLLEIRIGIGVGVEVTVELEEVWSRAFDSPEKVREKSEESSAAGEIGESSSSFLCPITGD